MRQNAALLASTLNLLTRIVLFACQISIIVQVVSYLMALLTILSTNIYIQLLPGDKDCHPVVDLSTKDIFLPPNVTLDYICATPNLSTEYIIQGTQGKYVNLLRCNGVQTVQTAWTRHIAINAFRCLQRGIKDPY